MLFSWKYTCALCGFLLTCFVLPTYAGEVLSYKQVEALKTTYEVYVQSEAGPISAIPGLGSAFYNGDGPPLVLVAGFANPTEDPVAIARLLGPGPAHYVAIDPASRIHPQTLFEMGSVTKTYTAATILHQSELGAISLDQSIDSWLPLLRLLKGSNCPTPENCPDIRELLGMISGIPDIDDSFCTPPTLCVEEGRPPALNAIMTKGNQFWEDWYTFEFLSTVDPQFPVGTQYAYSNTNYFLLGQVITQVENFYNQAEGYAWLKRKLHLENTYFGGFQAMPNEQRSPGWSSKGNLRANSKAFVSSYRGGGGMIATVGDTAVWIHQLLQPGKVLSAESLVAMKQFTPITPPGPLDPEVPEFVPVGYGLGLASYDIITARGTITVYGHLGLTGGFVSFAGYLPDKKLGFMLSINRRDTQNFFRIICQVVEIINA